MTTDLRGMKRKVSNGSTNEVKVVSKLFAASIESYMNLASGVAATSGPNIVGVIV